jgi:hypothetical protein
MRSMIFAGAALLATAAHAQVDQSPGREPPSALSPPRASAATLSPPNASSATVSPPDASPVNVVRDGTTAIRAVPTPDGNTQTVQERTPE